MLNLSIEYQNSSIEIEIDQISDVKPDIKKTMITDHLQHVIFTFNLKNSVVQDDWSAVLKPGFQSTFHWTPHLTPTDKHVIDQHVFRSPAIIVSDTIKVLILIPDLDILSEFYKTVGNAGMKKEPRWYLDLDAPNNNIIIGMCYNRVKEHVLFVKRNGAVFPPGNIQVGFYIMYYEDKEIANNPWRPTLEF